jgi:hypothetical protein
MTGQGVYQYDMTGTSGAGPPVAPGQPGNRLWLALLPLAQGLPQRAGGGRRAGALPWHRRLLAAAGEAAA